MITHEQMMAIPIDKGWYDGREGYYEWCHLGARLTMCQHNYYVSVTFMDKFEEHGWDGRLIYTDPQLEFSSNTDHGSHIETYDMHVVSISEDEAIALMIAGPKEVLVRYANELNRLSTPMVNT